MNLQGMVIDTLELSECFTSGSRNFDLIICCRSLTYHFDDRWLGHFWPTFPKIAELVGLTHLHLACCEEEAISLESLHNLRELALTNFTLLQELVVSSAAEMTKLSVQCGMVRSTHHAMNLQAKSYKISYLNAGAILTTSLPQKFEEDLINSARNSACLINPLVLLRS